MIKAQVSNCNNIKNAELQLRKNYLNIRYAMNGTGKSTIARAVEIRSKDGDLSILEAFGCDGKPACELSEDIQVLLFNEEYVDRYVLQKSEVMPNSFEVFVKNPDYEELKKVIDERLKHIHIDLSENEDVQTILATGNYARSNFKFNKDGTLRQTPRVKSLAQSGKVFNLPKELIKFQRLWDKEDKVKWVGWKNEGSSYDGNEICPFCAMNLGENYDDEKRIFTSSYQESNVKHILEMLSYLDKLKEFMNEDESEVLYKCIKETKDEPTVTYCIELFCKELDLLVNKIERVQGFNSFQVDRKDISNLERELNNLKMDISILRLFRSQRVEKITDFINEQIDAVLKKVDLLKSEMGQMKGLIIDTMNNAIEDINDFLATAGINYEFEITTTLEETSKTILKYKAEQPVEVTDIKQHLSWGERNAFALVLFMHDALSKNPDLIILDDPVSSFDSNKKYAILNRLFSTGNRKSLRRRTVLMLTHDLQPIIDCLINNKPSRECVSAYFLQNKSGVISEQLITRQDVKPLPRLLAENCHNEELNIVHRVASLRKLVEVLPNGYAVHESAYDLLSSLLKGRQRPTKEDGTTELTDEEISSGEEFITKHIGGFAYESYRENFFTRESLLKSFCEEQSPYCRLQIFRVLRYLIEDDSRTRINDQTLLKYINEQVHIENDYMFSLDFTRYDVVPDFFVNKCVEYLESENIIS